MPRQEQSIPVNDMDKETILALCYRSFQQLNWELKFAGDDKLLGHTSKTSKTKSQQVTVTAADNSLTVSSEMTEGELHDLGGKNKKNIVAFLAAFESSQSALWPAEKQASLAAIAALREETMKIATEERAQAEELDKAMNLHGNNLYATYVIIALNAIVFVLMAIDGAGIMEPNGLVHLKWGSNYAPLTLSGDWWRLITHQFIHFGIIHVGMNMYCLYSIGTYLEPLLGKPRYVAAYLCTGVFAGLVSLWWHTEPANSAGASGAVFGMYGLFFAFLTTSLIPERVRKGLFQSIGVFIVYNLAFGTIGSIDNSAHIGGLLSGFVFGYIYVAGIKKEKQGQHSAIWMVPLIVLITAVSAFYYLQHNKRPAEERTLILNELTNTGYKDNQQFEDAYKQFLRLQDTAIAPLKDTVILELVRDKQLKEISLPAWNKAESLAQQMQQYDVSAAMQARAANVLRYVQLRKKEIGFFNDIIAHQTPASMDSLAAVRKRIDNVVENLQ